MINVLGAMILPPSPCFFLPLVDKIVMGTVMLFSLSVQKTFSVLPLRHVLTVKYKFWVWNQKQGGFGGW